MSTLLAAADRLSLSRERLRAGLRASAAPRPSASHIGIDTPTWLARLQHLPGAGILTEALLTWWARSPLRIAGQVAADVGRTALAPFARRHPLQLALGAMLVGGLLSWTRPWRWALKPALFAGLGPQLLSSALSQVPMTPWLAALDSLTARRRTDEILRPGRR
jgi:hypothetical protein